MNCVKCNSTDVEVNTVQGRGLPPKGYVSRRGAKISWVGTWEMYTCVCGHEWRKLIR